MTTFGSAIPISESARFGKTVYIIYNYSPDDQNLELYNDPTIVLSSVVILDL